MDILLENGDFKRGSHGKPILVSGLDELKQRIYIRLKVKLGSFIYNRSLGSGLLLLSENPSDEELLECVRSVLPELFDVELLSAKVMNGSFKLEFLSSYGEFLLEIPLESEEE